MHGILRFWLDRGVDGFRADVVHLIGRDEEIPDHPAGREDLDIVGSHDHPRTHLLLRDIRRLLGEYDGDRVMIGEVPLAPATLLAPYYGSSDELHIVFDFALMHVPWSAEASTRVIAEAEDALPSPDHWPCWVLSNHDQPRHRSRFRGSDDRVSEGRARAAAVVLLTLRGTPCLYAGEELGLLDAVVPEPARIDPNGRDGSRAPIPWKVAPGHGWPGRTPLPLPPEPARRNAEAVAAEPDSILAIEQLRAGAGRRRICRELVEEGFALVAVYLGRSVRRRDRDRSHGMSLRWIARIAAVS